MIAGAEALAMGTLVVLVGMLLVVNAWAVVDTRMAVESAAREYLRAYTESTDPQGALTAARSELDQVLAERPAIAQRLEVTDPPLGSFGPCEPAMVTLSTSVPAIRIPLVGTSWGEQTVTVSAVELIDAHREIRSGPSHDPTRTACHG
ncbi:MAG: hypothetical protein ACK5O2_13470 [Microthrixaceae bacterium]